jgi:hypothetical protein
MSSVGCRRCTLSEGHENEHEFNPKNLSNNNELKEKVDKSIMAKTASGAYELIMGGIDRESCHRSIMAKTTVKAMTAKEFEAEFWTNQDPQDRYTFAEAYAEHLGANSPMSTLGEKTPESE